jgi:hypothetical protein
MPKVGKKARKRKNKLGTRGISLDGLPCASYPGKRRRLRCSNIHPSGNIRTGENS